MYFIIDLNCASISPKTLYNSSHYIHKQSTGIHEQFFCRNQKPNTVIDALQDNHIDKNNHQPTFASLKDTISFMCDREKNNQTIV